MGEKENKKEPEQEQEETEKGKEKEEEEEEEKVKFVYDIRMMKVLKTLKLTKEDLVHFWELFKKYDLNDNDLLDFNEFLPLVDKDSTIHRNYTENLFKLVEVENSTELSFSEFIHAVTTYCLFGPEDILKFCFYVFDKNRDGCIDHEELHALAKMLYSDAKNGNVEQVLKTFNKCKEGFITFTQFREINKTHPLLLYPAFRLQLKLRETVCGNDWWAKRMKKILKERRLSEAEHEKVLAEARRANVRERRDFLRRFTDNAPTSFRDIYSKWSNNASFRRSSKVSAKPELDLPHDTQSSSGTEESGEQKETNYVLSRRISMVRQWSSRMRGLVSTSKPNQHS